MAKKLYFGSNLKMYKTTRQTVDYLQELTAGTKDISRDEMELFIIPSYTALESAVSNIDRTYVKLGAQNMCWEDEGQFTGEISPVMLKALGIDLVMLGHSERRQVFGEADTQINKKVRAALKHCFTVLVCVGETAEQKEFRISAEVLRSQLKIALCGVEKEQYKRIWIAYEPVWSIGENGVPASAGYAKRMHQVIKDTLYEMIGPAGEQVPVLYGGSVNRENAEGLITQPSVDGLFIGRAAWNAADFNVLIRAAQEAYQAVKMISE